MLLEITLPIMEHIYGDRVISRANTIVADHRHPSTNLSVYGHKYVYCDFIM